MSEIVRRMRIAVWVTGATLLSLARVAPADVMATTLDSTRHARAEMHETAQFSGGALLYLR